MIKRAVVIVLLICSALSLAAEPMDMIVLLDVSQSMFPYFDDTINFLLKDIIDGHLQGEDGFHLISFAGSPEQEIHRVINSESDMEAVLARIMLLHPLGRHTDLLFAMNYLYDYVSQLPLRTSKNILILTDGVHDPPFGTSYPAETADQKESNRNEVIRVATEMKREGWQVRLIQFPRGISSEAGGAGSNELSAAEGRPENYGTAGTVPGAGKPEKTETGPATEDLSAQDTESNLYDSISEALGVDIIEYDSGSEMSHTATGAPRLSFPDRLGAVGRSFTVPFSVTNYLDSSILVKLDQVQTRGVNILDKPVRLKLGPKATDTLASHITLPETFEPGEYRLEVELLFSDDLRIYPREGELFFELKSPVNLAWIKIMVLVILGLALLYFLLFFIILPLARHIEQSAGADKACISLKSSSGREDEGPRGRPGIYQDGSTVNRGKVPLLEASHYTPGGKIPLSQISSTQFSTIPNEKPGHRPIEFRLSGQNPYNGGRNIRWVGRKRRSIGGGNSFFLIFLVKVPERIAEITFTDTGLRFTPVREEFFPSLSGPIDNCLNIPIVMVTEHGSFTMVFREWISPLERINHLLHLIDRPGYSSEKI